MRWHGNPTPIAKARSASFPCFCSKSRQRTLVPHTHSQYTHRQSRMMLHQVTALVTGAASGLGQATALRLLKQGARVVLADLPVTEATAMAALEAAVPDAGARKRGCFAGVDVLDPVLVGKGLDKAAAELGGTVNVVVNCAGVAVAQRVLGKKGPHSLEAFLKVLSVNAGGSFNVIRLAAERMARLPANDHGLKGLAVNTASIAAFEGQIGQAAYAASKGAVVGMTLPLARDLARDGVRVVSIAPGLFKTPMLAGLPDKVQQELGKTVPLPARLGNPDEYAQLVQAIIENPMINGEVIRLDGALRMPPS